ncbi:gag-pol polyprotein [Cucumis melo var. makuwa]|uniref:Gag-pol polyprotein n=1 Tax=Cucumis melo var. makuwa TaxID=1194695 RepID=A0A5A7T6E3_CUCMM|nr:gag-pol polyprotein [Cucumis melo var. makuwa]
MDAIASSSFSSISPSIFDGDNYQVWTVRMEAYMEALDIWEAVEEDYEIPALPNNPTMAQIKVQKEKKTKKIKAKACLFAAVSSTIFTRILTLRSAYEIWNYLKSKYVGDERIRGMRVLNLIREFELQKMKEIKSIKEYSVRLLDIANQIRLLESTKDLTQITLAEILNALQAQEQRKAMRQEGAVEGALPAKHHENGHPPFKCWRRPDAKCTKCNQMGHEAVICRNKNQQQGVEAKIADQEEEEDQLFVATCFMGGESNESWLIDSGCTNHMTHDKELFKDLKPTNITKVRIGNGDYISVKGNGTIAIASCKGLLQLTELALDFPKLSEEISSCKACHFGKQNRKSFPKPSWRATQKLQLIHTDVASPQRTPSLKGSLYYIAFIDDFTRIYIMEMTRCMLHEKSLPKKFWAEAANTAVFLQNRLPTKAVKEKTPFEAWYGYKPSLKFLKVFGCLCFTHVPQSKRDKLRRASPGVFIGYSSISKAYKIFQPQTGKIVVSRDVHFVEDEE